MTQATTRTLSEGALCVADITTTAGVNVSVTKHSKGARSCDGYRVDYSRRSGTMTVGGSRRFTTIDAAAVFAAERFAAYAVAS